MGNAFASADRKLRQFLPERCKRILRALRVHFLDLPLESLPDSPDLFRIYRQLQRHPSLERKPGGWLYHGEFYPDYLTVGGASNAISPKALAFCQGRGIDVGAGFWPLPGAIPVDISRGPGLGRRLCEFPDGTLDYVFSSHCLEHIEDWREALADWIAKLKPGGKIFLYLPHPECALWSPGSPFVGDGHKWVPAPDIMRDRLRDYGLRILECEEGPDMMQSFFVCAQKRGWDRK